MISFCVKKRITIAALAIFLSMADASWAIRLKIATLSPDGSMWMEKMRAGAKEVAEKTQSRVTFKFYPGGVMGNDNAVLRKIRIGQLHGGAVIGGSLSRFFPGNQIYALPMKFSTLEEVDYVRQFIDPFVTDGIEKAGFVNFGLIGGGFSYIMSQNPINTVADLKSQKIWLPDNERINEGAISAFNITPTTLPLSDVRTGLQSGLINTVATSPVGAVVLQWHTQINYVTDVPLIYFHGMLVIAKKAFSKISQADQKIVRTIMTRASMEIDRQNRLDNIKAIDALKKRGITFISPDSASREEWLATGRKASQVMVQAGLLPKEKIDELDRHLQTFHDDSR